MQRSASASFACVLAVAGFLRGAGRAAAQEVSLDWRIQHLSTKSDVVYEGPVTVECEWTAGIAKSGTWNKPIQWQGIVTVDGQSVRLFDRSYAPNQVSYIQPGSNEYKNEAQKKLDEAAGYDFTKGTATNEFDGAIETSVSVPKGAHKIGCMVAMSGSDTHESSTQAGNNKKEIEVDVQPLKQVAPGDFPSSKPPAVASNSQRNAAPQGSVGKVVLSRPTLSLTLPTTSFDQTCADPTQIATVSVGIHSDMPLAAYQGTIVVQDPNGQLNTAESLLPAIGANATIPMTVKLATTVPPSSLVGEHALNVVLNAKDAGGKPSFHAANSVTAGLAFPSGYCPSARMNPPPKAPGEGPSGPAALPESKGRGSGLMVTTPTAHSVAGRPANEKSKATTPVIPALKLPDPGLPDVHTPSLPLSAPSGSEKRTTAGPSSPSGAADRRSATPSGAPRVLRPGESLGLQDGRSLVKRGASLVLLGPRGDLLRTFPPDAEVFVGASGEVSVRTGISGEPLGLAKRN